MSGDAIGRFRDDASRAKFLAAYDKVLERWPGEHEREAVRTSFGEVHVRRAGRSDGPPVVLLHGGFATSASWYPSVAAFGEQHELYAFDCIGEPGLSDQTRPIRGGEDEAAWVAEAMTGLGIDAAHLIGMSRGGFVGLHTAIHRGERLRTLSLIEPFGFAPVRPKFHVASVIGAVAMLVTPPPVRDRVLRLVGNGALTDRDLFRLMVAGLSGYRPSVPPLVPFSDESLGAIAVPTLALFAERSNLHHADRARARALAAVPDIAAEIFPKAGHALSYELPDEVNERVLRFLAATPAR